MGLKYTVDEIVEIRKCLINNPSILFSPEKTKGIVCDLVSDKDAASFFSDIFEKFEIINQMRKIDFSKDRLVMSIHDKHIELDAVKVAINFWTELINEEILKQYDFVEIKYIAENKTERPEKVYEHICKLYNMAKTYEEYKKVASLFELILDYGNSAEYAEKCKRNCRAMIACKDAKRLLSLGTRDQQLHYWESSIKFFNKIINTLSSFSDYEESSDILLKAKELLPKSELKYKEQKEYEDIYDQAMAFFSNATTIDAYKKAGELFNKVLKYSDETEKKHSYGSGPFKSTIFPNVEKNYELCGKRIKEITIEEQYQTIYGQKESALKENNLQKRSELLQSLIKTYEPYVLSEKAKIVVEESKKLLSECLTEIENQRIQSRFEEAKKFFEKDDLITDYKERINAFSQIISDFEADAKTEDFSKLISDCRDRISEANLNINYNFAEMLMTSAETEADFNSAATAFGKICDFKDSLEKKQVCIENAKKCAIEETYNLAMEKIEQSKKISFFNWKKYR